MRQPRPFLRLAWVLALLPAACRDEPGSEPLRPEIQARLAWVGEDADGLRVVAERLPDFRGVIPDALTEEKMLREALRVDDELALLRLHLIGAPAELAEAGRLSGPRGEEFGPLPASPDEESPRARLLRAGLADGGIAEAPAIPGVHRRSFLLAGRGGPPHENEDLIWNRGARSLPLAARAWTEPERRAFLEGPEPAEHEND